MFVFRAKKHIFTFQYHEDEHYLDLWIRDLLADQLCDPVSSLDVEVRVAVVKHHHTCKPSVMRKNDKREDAHRAEEVVKLIQKLSMERECCGSAFIRLLWIRIRTGNADPDPGAWKLTKLYK
jgi:hypothetical protein